MQQNPYQAPHVGYQGYPAPGGLPGAGGYSTESIVSIAKPTMALMAIRAGWSLLMRAVGMLGLGSEALYAGLQGLRSLVSLAAVICFLIWFARVHRWVAATHGPLRTSTAMTVWAWFIPFANFVFPYLNTRDVWRRANGDQDSIVVVGWWAAYLVVMVLEIFWGVFRTQPDLMLQLAGGGDPETTNTVLDGLSWLTLLANVAAYGLWFWIVRTLTERAATAR